MFGSRLVKYTKLIILPLAIFGLAYVGLIYATAQSTAPMDAPYVIAGQWGDNFASLSANQTAPDVHEADDPAISGKIDNIVIAATPGDLRLTVSAGNSILVTDTTPITETTLPITVTLHRDNAPIDATGDYSVQVYAGDCTLLPGTPGTLIYIQVFGAGAIPASQVFTFDHSFSSSDYDTLYADGAATICLTAEIVYSVTVVESDITNNDTFDVPEIVYLIKQADLQIVKETDPVDKNTVLPNETVDYVITVTNTNAFGITLNDIEITDNLDSDLLLVSAVTCNPAVCGTIDTSDPTKIVVAIPSLAANSSVDITYTGQVSGTVSGLVLNTAEVKISGGLEDTDLGNNSSYVALGVDDIADLMIDVTETDGAENAYSGATKDFTVTITNVLTTGPNPASVQVNLADASLYHVGGDSNLVTAISWTCSGICPTPASGTGMTNFFDMTTDDVATFTVTVTTSSEAIGNLTYGASFVVDETNLTDVSSPHSDSQTVALYQMSDPELVSVTDGRVSVSAGNSLRYSIVVTNSGPSPANTILVTGTFIEGFSNIEQVYLPRVCDSSGSATCAPTVTPTSDGFTIEVYNLDPGETVQIATFVQTSLIGFGDIVLQVEVAAVDPAEDSDPTNNSSIAPANGAVIDNHHDITNVPPPAPFFINFGDAAGCDSVQYDDGSIGTTPAPTWQINQAYAPGGWGYVDDNQPSTITLHDDTNGGSSTADKLFNCYLQARAGNAMAVRFDNTFHPGAWKMYLAFGEPSNASTGAARFFDVDVHTGTIDSNHFGTTTTGLLSNYNIAAVGDDFILECEITITNTNDLALWFTSIGGNALISGIGFEYIGESGASNSCLGGPPPPPLAEVDAVEIEIDKNAKVTVYITGILPSKCVKLNRVEQSRIDNQIEIQVSNRVNMNKTCAPSATPYTLKVILEGGFPPGDYSVFINGVEYMFTIP